MMRRPIELEQNEDFWRGFEAGIASIEHKKRKRKPHKISVDTGQIIGALHDLDLSGLSTREIASRHLRIKILAKSDRNSRAICAAMRELGHTMGQISQAGRPQWVWIKQ